MSARLIFFFDRHLGPQHAPDQVRRQPPHFAKAQALHAFGGGHHQIEIPTQGKIGFVEQRNLDQENLHARRKAPGMIDGPLKNQRMQQ